MKLIWKSRKRRGLSSIVGALFFIVLLVAAFTALLAAFSYQNDLIDSQTKTADLEVAKAHEKFFVTADMNPADNMLFVTVKNQGTNPVEIVNLWVIEKGVDYEANRYDLSSSPSLNFNDVVIPIGTAKDITSGVIELFPPKEYTVKVVSRLGTVVTLDVPDTTIPQGPEGDQGLSCWDTDNDGYLDPSEDLYPPGPPPGDGLGTALDCQGQSGGPPGINCWDSNANGINEPSEDVYPPGPPPGDGVFNGLDCQGPEGPEGPPGQAETIDIGLLNKPEIFMIFPSPFGEYRNSNPGPNYGVWGVTIANPSQNTMAVNKIVITAIPATTISGQTVFKTCPTPQWTCTGNQMIWTGPVGGDTINAKSAKSYFVRTSPSANNDEILNGFPVFASVLTDYGQFGKTNYLSSMISPTGNTNEEAIVNVYRSDTQDSLTDIKGTWVFESGQQLTSYFSISDNSTSNTDAYIKKDVTNLIVNVPKTFIVDSANGFTSFTIPPIVPNIDTSTQVIANLSENVGGGVGSTSDVRSMQLTITAPTIPAGQQPKLYVMYVLAEGEAWSPYQNANWQIGPIDEVVIRVNPLP